jgi:hypothetical protein
MPQSKSLQFAGVLLMVPKLAMVQQFHTQKAPRTSEQHWSQISDQYSDRRTNLHLRLYYLVGMLL